VKIKCASINKRSVNISKYFTKNLPFCFGVKFQAKKNIILRNRLTTRNSERDKLDIPGVYCIPCKDCKNSYIGQTGRTILTRLDEHRRSTRVNSTISSAVKEHALVLNHTIYFNNVTA
jgi:hypothetical protein